MKKNKIYIVVLGLIILAAAFLRLYRLDEFVTFLGDQGRDAIIIKRILTLEHFPAIGAPSSVGQVYLGPFYYYLMAPFLLLFFFDPIGLAYGVAFLSIIGILVSYLFLKKELGRFVSLAFVILIGFSYVNIDASRYSWNPNLLPFFTFFSLYFFYQSLKSRQLIYSILFGAFYAFSVQLHHLSLLMGGAFAIWLGLFIYRFGMSKKILIKLSCAIMTFLFFSIPLLIFDLKHNFLNTNNFIKLFTEKSVVSQGSPMSRFMDTSSAFFTHTFRAQVTGPVSILILVLIIAISIYLYRKKMFSSFASLNLLNFFSFLLLFSFLDSGRHPHYYGVIYASFFIILAVFLNYFRRFGKKGLVIVGLSIIIYVGLNIKDLSFLIAKSGSNQIRYAKQIATAMMPSIDTYPYQVVALPPSVSDGHIRYFLEKSKTEKPLPEDSPEEPKELFVLCHEVPCTVIGNAQWQIASFKNAKIDKIIPLPGVTVYKLVHIHE